MDQRELNSIGRDIIKNNIYLTLATTGGKSPWASPLFYCVDDKYNFYFISQMDSLHTKNLLENPQVSFAIFDSHSPEGQGNGIQASGVVELIKEEDISQALNWYSTNFVEITKESLKSSSYKLFRIIPKKFYTLDTSKSVDVRAEITLP